MRQRVIKALAAFLLIVAGVTATAVVAGAIDGDNAPLVTSDTNSWE